MFISRFSCHAFVYSFYCSLLMTYKKHVYDLMKGSFINVINIIDVGKERRTDSFSVPFI